MKRLLQALCYIFGGHDGPLIECGRTSHRICLFCGKIYVPKTVNHQPLPTRDNTALTLAVCFLIIGAIVLSFIL